MLVLLACQIAVLYTVLLLPLQTLARQLRQGENGKERHLSAGKWWHGSEFTGIVRHIQQAFDAVRDQYQHDLETARLDLMGMYSKERQDKFATKLAHELSSCSSSAALAQKLINSVDDEFPNLLHWCFAVIIPPNLSVELCAHNGLNEEAIAGVLACKGKEWAVKLKNGQEVRDGPVEELASLALAMLIPEQRGYRYYQYLVGSCGGSNFFLCCLIKQGDTLQTQKFQRYLDRLVTISQPLLNLILRFEEEFREARTDQMTGLPNLKSLQEYFAEFGRIEQSREEKFPVCMILFDCDGFVSINKNHGKSTADAIISLVASILSKNAVGALPRRKKLFGDRLYRVGACRFLLVLEDVSWHKALEIAERGRAAIESHSGWPGGVPSITVSAGVAAYPESAAKIADLQTEAEVCIAYIHAQQELNRVVSSTAVPGAFRQKMHRHVLEVGDQFFGPLEMFNSICAAKKTGLLTATEPQGRSGWIFFQDGVPERARCGKLTGGSAAVEVLSAWDEVSFRFDGNADFKTREFDRGFKGARAQEKITDPAAIESQAVLAAETLRQSRLSIVSTDMYLMPLAASRRPEAWNNLIEDICVEQLEVMK